MFDFIKSKFTRAAGASNSEAEALVEEFASQNINSYPFDLKKFTAGVKYQSLEPEMKCAVVLGMVAWLEKKSSGLDIAINGGNWQTKWRMREALAHMLRQKLPFTEQEVIRILNWSASQQKGYVHYRNAPQVIKVAEDHLKDNPLSGDLRQAILKLMKALESDNKSVEVRRWIMRLKELTGDTEINLPLEATDVWANAALGELRALEPSQQTAWAELLLHCLRTTGSAPSSKWLQSADKHLNAIGFPNYINAILRWFPLVDQPRPAALLNRANADYLTPVNTDILKGLVWLCSKADAPEVARTLTAVAVSTYKKIPGTGPRAAKAGNACFWALGNMSGVEGAAQLSILKTKIKINNAQKAIANALESAAQRTGMTADEIEEISIPVYGLQEVGLRRADFGDALLEIRVNGSDVEQAWSKKDGKKIASAPKAVKEKHAEELKEISQAVKDLRKMLTVQRDRIDNLYLLQQKWSYQNWQARYLNHPLVGTIARRLIWKFSKGDKAASAIWFEGHIVGRDHKPLAWLDDSTTVELWHPIHVDVNIVLEWRQWLLDHEVRQPFKQAYREVYILTDAELNTRVYSNRYAAHILRQHQFNALCAVRGWKNSLRLMVDADFPPAVKNLPHWNLRAEFWIEGIGDNYGADTNTTGTFLYLTTDQVRFYQRDAMENRAHAGGGGYVARRWNGTGAAEPLPLAEIPALVFSEIMRDVDMFVGVASIGNDPNWLDGGADVHYRDYWHGYSFGDLTESAKTRKQLLEALIPRLKISARCKLTDKFLVVRGDIRTYKIHLGSGNILMEPNDQYLCIVPARGGSEMGREKLFIPFEGDQTLSIILSKAFLLAEDKKITDTTITRQLK
jgi:hypothetical protein